jgi:hypothetical protein
MRNEFWGRPYLIAGRALLIPTSAQSLELVVTPSLSSAPLDLSTSSIPDLQRKQAQQNREGEQRKMRDDLDAQRSRLDELEAQRREDEFQRMLRRAQ